MEATTKVLNNHPVDSHEPALGPTGPRAECVPGGPRLRQVLAMDSRRRRRAGECDSQRVGRTVNGTAGARIRVATTPARTAFWQTRIGARCSRAPPPCATIHTTEVLDKLLDTARAAPVCCSTSAARTLVMGKRRYTARGRRPPVVEHRRTPNQATLDKRMTRLWQILPGSRSPVATRAP
jgi:hypothetical protein